MNHSDSTEITERIRRIIEMENRYDRISLALHAVGVCPDRLDSIRNDIQALSNAIIALAKSEERRQQYGLAARSIVEKKYNAKRVAEMVTQIYNQN